MPARWLRVFACIVGSVLGVAPVLAQEGGVAGAVAPERDLITACQPHDPEREVALQTLGALSRRIEALPPGSSPAEEVADLKSLLQSRCFGLADGWPGWNEDEPSTAHSLQVFWRSGGEAWFRHFLDLHAPGIVRTWTRPTVRVALGSDTHPEHPLASLLCPLGSSSCGLETRGWELRAEAALRAFAQREAYADVLRSPDKARRATVDGCVALAAEQPEQDRWTSLVGCLQEAEPTQDALPLGRMSAPGEGWWVVRGRRGHYAFCDEVRAYHLPTGSVFGVASCGQLALRRDGSVDGAETDAGRVVTTQVGRVPLGLLREAVWMALLAPEVQEDVVLSSAGIALPPDTSPVRRRGPRSLGLGFSGQMASHLTTLDWIWSPADGGAARHSGELSWPEDLNRAAYDHAVRLLQVAEASFSSGCRGTALPDWIVRELARAGPMGVSHAVLRKLTDTVACSD